MDLFQRNSTLLDDRLEIEVAGLGEKNALHTSITYPLDAFGCLVGFYRHPRQQSCPCVGPDGRVLTFLDFGGAELGRELRVSRAWLED